MPYSALSIGQLAAHGDDIRFVCHDCGASVLAPIEQVLRRFSGERQVGWLQAHIFCPHCLGTDVVVLPVTKVAA